MKKAIWSRLHWNTNLTLAQCGNCSQACSDKYNRSLSCLPWTLPKPTKSLCPLPWATPLNSPEGQIREVSTASLEAYNFLSYLVLFSPFMKGLLSDYNCFLLTCTIISENTYRSEIFHTYAVWFSPNSMKIQHYLILNETQKDSLSPSWKQLQKTSTWPRKYSIIWERRATGSRK